MSLTINIYYTGKNGNAKKFANEMISTGIVDSTGKTYPVIIYGDYYFNWHSIHLGTLLQTPS